MNFKFLTIKKPIEGIIYKEKSSKFIGYIYPINSSEEIKFYIDKLKKEHPLSAHICFAFRQGIQGEIYRTNDDGEPNGTAGIPILNRLISYKLTNVILFIIRYFGGTKLGVSGLISAYKISAEQTILESEIILQKLMKDYDLKTSFEFLSKILNIIEKNQIEIISSEYKENVFLKIKIPEENINYIIDKITKIHHSIELLEC